METLNNTNTYTRYFAHPFPMLVTGPTGCGKTQWIKKLIRCADTVCMPPPKRIIYVYSIWQPVFNELKGVEFVKGLSEGFFGQFDGSIPCWIILDDVMDDAINSSSVANLFTKGSHHLNLSVIFIVQNLFKQGKYSRDITQNIHYGVIFKNPRDKSIIANFAKQFSPGKSKALLDIFTLITKKPFSPMVIDFKTDTPDELRIMSNVFGEEPEGAIMIYQL